MYQQILKRSFLAVCFVITLATALLSNQLALSQTPESLSFEIRNDWQYAAKSAPQHLMKQVAEENVEDEWLGDPNRMKIAKVNLPQQKSALYLIDTRVQYECPPIGCDPALDPLCDRSGCTYLGYIQSGKSYRRVFSERLKSALTPEKNFLGVSQQLIEGMPCLEFHEQTESAADQLSVRHYCFNGEKYDFRSVK